MSDCILWTGAKAGNGYGVLSVAGKQKYAHRDAWERANGPIPVGMVVAHRCDTPECFNPSHLFVCTQAENLADMRKKGRAAAGEKHGSKTKPWRTAKGERVSSAKLSEEQVAEIRAAYRPARPGRRSETSLSAIARQYGVAFQTISKIINQKTWSHV